MSGSRKNTVPSAEEETKRAREEVEIRDKVEKKFIAMNKNVLKKTIEAQEDLSKDVKKNAYQNSRDKG